MENYFTKQNNFFGSTSPQELIAQYGSPLYVYNEAILRQRCHDMATLVNSPGFCSNYSIKANSNLEILKIAREEGLHADAMSPGEIHILMMAGYQPNQLLFVSNNVSADEMRYAVERDVLVSCDSLSQLETFGRNFPGKKVAARFNPGVGAGHHEKVVTGGKNTKFGINMDLVPQVKEVLQKYNITLVGINQHIGSLFMEASAYIEGVRSLLKVAEQFDTLEFVDMGGGFGIPYHKQDGEMPLDIADTGKRLTELIDEWTASHGRSLTIKMEPGRYVVAESCVLLGTVHAIKNNSGQTFVGTDLGFNVLARPMMYDSHHDIEVYGAGTAGVVGAGSAAQAAGTAAAAQAAGTGTAAQATGTTAAAQATGTATAAQEAGTEAQAAGTPTKPELQTVTVVGNICESGDIIAKDRNLPIIHEQDILGIMDSGAYGYSMASNYNSRLRPAEVMIGLDGKPRLIRRRDTIEDLIRNFV